MSIKSMVKGNISRLNIIHAHYITNDKNIIHCNGFGHKIKKIKSSADEIDIKNYYINHFCFKSTEEFSNKMIRGDVRYGYNTKKIFAKISNYFRYNLITMKKIILIENKTGLKLYEIRKKLKMKKI